MHRTQRAGAVPKRRNGAGIAMVTVLLLAPPAPGQGKPAATCACPSTAVVTLERMRVQANGRQWDEVTGLEELGRMMGRTNMQYPDLTIRIQPRSEPGRRLCEAQEQPIDLPSARDAGHAVDVGTNLAIGCGSQDTVLLEANGRRTTRRFCLDRFQVTFADVPLPPGPFQVSILDIDLENHDLFFEHRDFPLDRALSPFATGSRRHHFGRDTSCVPDGSADYSCVLLYAHGAPAAELRIQRERDDPASYLDQPEKAAELIRQRLFGQRNRLVYTAAASRDLLTDDSTVERFFNDYQQQFGLALRAAQRQCKPAEVYQVFTDFLMPLRARGYGDPEMTTAERLEGAVLDSIQLALEDLVGVPEPPSIDEIREEYLSDMRRAMRELAANLRRGAIQERTWRRMIERLPADMLPFRKTETMEEIANHLSDYSDKVSARWARRMDFRFGRGLVTAYKRLGPTRWALQIMDASEDIASRIYPGGRSAIYQQKRRELAGIGVGWVDRVMREMGYAESPAWKKLATDLWMSWERQ